MTTPHRKVHWTKAETELVVDQYLILAAQVPGNSTTKVLIRIREAQLVLPEARRRKITGLHNLKNFLPLCVITSAGRELARQQAEDANAAEAANAVKAEAESKKGSSLDAHGPKATSTDAKSVLFSMFDQFIEAIAHRVADIVQERMAKPASAPPAVAPQPAHKPFATKPSSVLKLRIGILGLLNGQKHTIATKFPNVVFYFSDKSLPKKRPVVACMIGMVGFISHAADDAAYKQYGSKYRRASGGMSQLQLIVSDLCDTFQEEIDNG